MASIEKRRNAKTGKITGFRVKWRLGGVRDGEWQSATFPREQKAKEFRAKVEANAHQWPEEIDESAASIPAEGISVNHLAELYLADRARRVRSDRTCADYRRDYERWIKPTFGTRSVNDIRDKDIQVWIDSIPRAAKTVAGLHALMSAMFTWGARSSRGLVDKTPFGTTELPKRRKGKAKGLRAGEWAILYQAACAESPDTADLLLFLVGTGWRWSEMAALQVMHLDLDREHPVVEMAQVRRRGAHGVALVEDAKSDAGERRIRLSPMLVEMLKRRVTGKALGDYVFAGPMGKPLNYGNFRSRVWDRPAAPVTARRHEADPGGILVKAAALGLAKRPTIHWLRHTHVGLLIDTNEVTMPGLQRRVGHASITTTVDTYGRMVDDVSTEALSALDGVLFGRKTLRAVK